MSRNNGNGNDHLFPAHPEDVAPSIPKFDDWIKTQPEARKPDDYDRLIDDVLDEQAIDLSAGFLPEDDTE